MTPMLHETHLNERINIIRRQVGRVLVVLVMVSAGATGPALADVSLQFDLGQPTTNGTTETLDVSLIVAGTSSVAIDAIQLSVLGSSPQLSAGSTDFSRFTFQLDTSALPGFSELVPLSLSGVGLIAADLGSEMLLSPGTLHLGTLSVDLTGLAAVSGLSVSLAGGPPPLGTDAGGTIDGTAVDSFAAADPGTAQVGFGQPAGVVLTAAVPEPSGPVRLIGAVACLLGYIVLRSGLARIRPRSALPRGRQVASRAGSLRGV